MPLKSFIIAFQKQVSDAPSIRQLISDNDTSKCITPYIISCYS